MMIPGAGQLYKTHANMQDVMKRKAMEIEKSKIESARTGKTGGTGGYNPSGPSSININNNRSTTDLDLTPTFSRCLPTTLVFPRHAHVNACTHARCLHATSMAASAQKLNDCDTSLCLLHAPGKLVTQYSILCTLFRVEKDDEGIVCACRPDTSSLKPKAGAAPKKGMQLGKARKANDFLESLRAEGEVIQVSR